MLKAASLIYALLLSLLVALVASSLVLVSHYHRTTLEHHWMDQRLIRNAQSGIRVLLSRDEESFNKSQQIDLFGMGKDSILLQAKPWGFFQVLSSSAFHSKDSFELHAITGRELIGKDSLALYLADHHQPLTVSGNTEVQGVCYLPEAGVKLGTINGQHFQGENPINGKINTSVADLPALKTIPLKTSINEWVNRLDLKEYRDFTTWTKDSMVVPFNKEVLFLGTEQDIILQEVNYSGNVVFLSKGTIHIKKTAHLEDVLVFGKEVIIEKGFTGNLQIFAEMQIILQEGVSLSYPSALYLNVKQAEAHRQIVFNKEASLCGIVSIDGKYSPSKLLVLEEGSNINGQVWIAGDVELKGNIGGSLYCHQFLLHTPSSKYINHLLNTRIEPMQRSAYFSGISIMEKMAQRSIAKWIHY